MAISLVIYLECLFFICDLLILLFDRKTKVLIDTESVLQAYTFVRTHLHPSRKLRARVHICTRDKQLRLHLQATISISHF
jgi:hypothetical protein